MKKFLVFILSILVVGLIAYGSMQFWKPKALTADDVLPEGAIAYLRITDVAPLMEEFLAGDMWKALREIDVTLLAKKSAHPVRNLESWYIFNKNVVEPLSNPTVRMFLEKFLGKEIAIGVYPMEMEFDGKNDIWEFLSDVIFVTRVAPEVKFLNIISGIFSQANRQMRAETILYRKHRIINVNLSAFALPFGTISYTKIGDYMVLGFSENAARSCIDVLEKRKASIITDKRYLTARKKFLESPHAMGYLDLRTTFDVIKQSVLRYADSKGVALEKKFAKYLDRFFSSVPNFDLLSSSAVFGESVKFRTEVSYDLKGKDPKIFEGLSCSPKENNSIKLVPDDVLTYYWFGCHDFSSYWKDAQKELAHDEEFVEEEGGAARAIDGLESFLQVDIEKDILEALGKQLGWCLSDIDFKGVFPLPHTVFYFDIADMDKAKKALDKLDESQFIVLQEETYRNIPIKYIVLPLGLDIQPSFCFIGNQLILTSHRKLIKKSIDIYRDDKGSLVDAQKYKGMNLDTIDGGNTIVFVRSADLVQDARTMIDWIGAWARERYNKQKAYAEGTRQRLQALNAEVEGTRGVLKELEEKMGKMLAEKDQKEALASQEGAEVSGQGELDNELTELKFDIEKQRRALMGVIEKRDDQQKTVEELAQWKTMEIEDFDLYNKSLFQPILNALEAVNVVGIKIKATPKMFRIGTSVEMK